MKFLICGRTGTGKDTLQDILVNRYGWKSVKSYTTRKPRYKGEDTHIFISHEEAAKIPKEDKVAVTYIKNGDIEDEYFATRKQVAEADCYIIDPIGIEKLAKNMPEENFVIIYMRPENKDVQRLMAVMRAGDQKEANDIFDKRYASEDAQFTEFEKNIAEDNLLQKNCCVCFELVNDYSPKSMDDIAENVIKVKNQYDNILRLLPLFKKNGSFNLDESGNILICNKELVYKAYEDSCVAYLLLTAPKETFGTLMLNWISSDNLKNLIEEISFDNDFSKNG